MKLPHQAADVKRQQFLTDEADGVFAGSFLKSLKLNQTHVFFVYFDVSKSYCYGLYFYSDSHVKPQNFASNRLIRKAAVTDHH